MTEATVTVLRHDCRGRSWEGGPRSSTPPWLDDDLIVDRALAAKRDHPPSLNFWVWLAELARLCGLFVTGAVHDETAVGFTRWLADSLAVQLPNPRSVPRGLHLRPRPDINLADLVTTLAATLADPYPADLDALASVLDELADLLFMFPRVAATTAAPTDVHPCHGPGPPRGPRR